MRVGVIDGSLVSRVAEDATRSGRPLLATSVLLVTGLVISGLHPYDRVTWAMEVARS